MLRNKGSYWKNIGTGRFLKRMVIVWKNKKRVDWRSKVKGVLQKSNIVLKFDKIKIVLKTQWEGF